MPIIEDIAYYPLGNKGEDQSSKSLDWILLLRRLAWVKKCEIVSLVSKVANNQEGAQSHNKIHEFNLPFGSHVLQTYSSHYHKYAQKVHANREVENGTTTSML